MYTAGRTGLLRGMNLNRFVKKSGLKEVETMNKRIKIMLVLAVAVLIALWLVAILSIMCTLAVPAIASEREISPQIASSGTWVTILTLNPTSDPNGACLEPFSSGTGYLGVPQWVHHTVDLASYANTEVQVRLYFDTKDSKYNKFEGWYVDNIVIDGFSDDVESGNIGWVMEGSHSTPSWHITTRRSSVTNIHSWWYGDELS